MSMQVGDSKAGPMAAINVTPMADIMIVLLIIFMVITPMLAKGVDVKLPTANNTETRTDKQKTLIVAIKNDTSRTTYLNGKKIENLAELTQLVKAGLEELPEDEKVLYIKADQELLYSDVMKVMDFVREGGVEDVALIAERKVEG
jgi:biopolymer transport protein ExbD